jgi:putative transposase
MSRYRLVPSPAQEVVLRDHCAQARFGWNLAVEQHRHWRPGRKSAPGYLAQCRQLTQGRGEHPWLAAGYQMVQQQALRDFARAMADCFGGTHERPSWRKAGRPEGFAVVALKPRDVRRLSRHVGAVRVPQAGWVRFRWSRAVPPGVKSCRVTRDRAGRWHVAFAAVPAPVPAPGSGQTAGVDRGVAVSAALSTGDLLGVPGLGGAARTRLLRLQRTLAWARYGSHRRGRVRHAIARLKARPERAPEVRPQLGDPGPGMGPAGPPPAGQGPRPGGEDHTALHQPAVLGVRARGPEVASEPSALCVHDLRFRRPR